ncbi:MAG: hypothetical protein ACTSVZ_05475 [Promethearchaeota archaeon]
MRILALVGSILTLTGSIINIIYIFIMLSMDIYSNLLIIFGLSGSGLFWLGIFLVHLSGFFNSTVMMKVGSGFSMSALIFQSLFYGTALYSYFSIILYVINGLMILASIIYLLGCISFKKYSKLPIISGILLLLSTFAIYGFIGFFMTYEGYDYHGFLFASYLSIGFTFQGFLWALHSFLFSFLTKKVGWEEKEGKDNLSVKNGGAFSSYLPDNSDKSKKKKKGSGRDNVKFDF